MQIKYNKVIDLERIELFIRRSEIDFFYVNLQVCENKRTYVRPSGQ